MASDDGLVFALQAADCELEGFAVCGVPVDLPGPEDTLTQFKALFAELLLCAEALGVASVPIPGTRRASRVEENLGSLSVTLTPAELTALDAAGATVAGNRADDMTAVSAGRE